MYIEQVVSSSGAADQPRAPALLVHAVQRSRAARRFRERAPRRGHARALPPDGRNLAASRTASSSAASASRSGPPSRAGLAMALGAGLRLALSPLGPTSWSGSDRVAQLPPTGRTSPRPRCPLQRSLALLLLGDAKCRAAHQAAQAIDVQVRTQASWSVSTSSSEGRARGSGAPDEGTRILRSERRCSAWPHRANGRRVALRRGASSTSSASGGGREEGGRLACRVLGRRVPAPRSAPTRRSAASSRSWRSSEQLKWIGTGVSSPALDRDLLRARLERLLVDNLNLVPALDNPHLVNRGGPDGAAVDVDGGAAIARHGQGSHRRASGRAASHGRGGRCAGFLPLVRRRRRRRPRASCQSPCSATARSTRGSGRTGAKRTHREPQSRPPTG